MGNWNAASALSLKRQALVDSEPNVSTLLKPEMFLFDESGGVLHARALRASALPGQQWLARAIVIFCTASRGWCLRLLMLRQA